MPQVRSNTSGSTSMAMSQRTPSHCPAIFTSSRDHRLLSGRVAVVELQRVGPAGEIRIAAVGEHQVALRSRDPRVVLRRARQVLLGARDEVLGMLLDPGMIQAGVVGDEVEHQPQAARAEPLAQAGQRRVAAQLLVHGVAGDGEPGAGDVLLAQVGQRLLKLPAPLRVGAGDCAALRARSARRSGTRSSRSPSRPGDPARRRGCRPAWPAGPDRRDNSVSQTRVLI